MDDPLLTPAEVARILQVDPKTVLRWAKAGHLHPVRTLGGHRWYRASDVYAFFGISLAEWRAHGRRSPAR